MSNPSPAGKPTPSGDSTIWRQQAGLFGGATVLALLTFTQQWFGFEAGGEDVSVWFVALWSMTPWYFWAAVATRVTWLGRRVPAMRGNLLRAIPVHLAAALILGVASSLLIVFLIGITGTAPTNMVDTPFWVMILAVSLWQMTTNLMTYGAILGGGYAIDFYRRYQERELAASRLSQQLANAQLQALRMQLNPHFLFNAMNAVAMMVRKQENDEAVRTLAELSDLLRYVLEDTQSQEVTLRKELEFVRQYLGIEQVRFGDRLTVRIETTDEALDARVPNLLLQPLVENAVRHGIARLAAATLVEVVAHVEDGDLVIEVRDDGPGLPTIPTTAGGGLGIHNTQARLKQMYGEHQQFRLRNGEGGGAIASVRLPHNTGKGRTDR